MFYIVDNDGTVHAESEDFYRVQALLDDMLEEPENEEKELEIICDDYDKEERDMAAEMDEMIALGWTDEEAHQNEKAFFERVGYYAKFFKPDEVWMVWRVLWDEHLEDGCTE